MSSLRQRRIGTKQSIAKTCCIGIAALVSLCAATTATSQPTGTPAVAEYPWRLPPGFAKPVVPVDNPMSIAKVALGRRLFNEPRLSVTGRFACVNCHRPELAFTDGKARAQGALDEPTKRAAMTLTNVAYNAAFTWGDASVLTLEAQMRQPLFNEHPVEMGLQGREPAVVAMLQQDADYRQQFAAAFVGEPTPISMDNLIKAIAAFERTLISGRSSFDRYVFDDERNALSPAARRGMTLFYSARVGCAQCHFGLNFSGTIRYEGHADSTAIFANTGLYNLDGHGSYPSGDQGLIDITHRAEDMGKFRVPTLRNIALTAPYMHDGSISTLVEVIEHYANGGRQNHAELNINNQLKDRRILPFTLSDAEQRELVAFLESLTDRQFINDAQLQ